MMYFTSSEGQPSVCKTSLMNDYVVVAEVRPLTRKYWSESEYNKTNKSSFKT